MEFESDQLQIAPVSYAVVLGDCQGPRLRRVVVIRLSDCAGTECDDSLLGTGPRRGGLGDDRTRCSKR